MSGKRLFIGTIDTLFDDDYALYDENDEELFECCEIAEKKLNESALYDGNDDILMECCKNLENASENVEKSELDDGNDDMLNKSYDSVKILVENKMFVEKRSVIPQNMQYLVKNTKKEIERNHLLAKIRLSEGKKNWSAKFKSDMADYFASVESWPNYALKLLFSKHFGYTERIGFACFFTWQWVK